MNCTRCARIVFLVVGLTALAPLAVAASFEEILRKAAEAAQALKQSREQGQPTPQAPPPPQQQQAGQTPPPADAIREYRLMNSLSPAFVGPSGDPDILVRLLQQSLDRPVTSERKIQIQGRTGATMPPGASLGLSVLDMGVAQPYPRAGDQLRGQVDRYVFVGLLAEYPLVVAARSDLDVPGPAQLRDWLIARGDRAGIAVDYVDTPSTPNLCAQLLAEALGIKPSFVEFQARYVEALPAARFDIVCESAPKLRELVVSGRARVLAVGSTLGRAPAPFDKAPTFAALGWKNMPAGNWLGLHAPVGTAPAVVERLAAAAARIVQDPAWAQAVETAGGYPARGGPTEHEAHVRAQAGLWGRVSIVRGAVPGAVVAGGAGVSGSAPPVQQLAECGGANRGAPPPGTLQIIDVTRMLPKEHAVKSPDRTVPRNDSFTFLEAQFSRPGLRELFERAAEQPLDPAYYLRQTWTYRVPAYDKYRAELDALPPAERNEVLSALFAHARYFSSGSGAAGIVRAFPELRGYTYVWGRPLDSIRQASRTAQYSRERDKPPGPLCHGSLVQFMHSPVQARVSDYVDNAGDWVFQTFLQADTNFDPARIR
jgi:tripartite-type tricarboxylate transporter receptor subunit TctC